MMSNLLQPGSVLQNRYVIQRVLGQGGMGAVYVALDTRLGNKSLALKENFDNSKQAQDQFQMEANLLANLSHPNLPRVTDHFIELSGRQYLVMDYVAGQDLESLVENSGPLPINQAVQWTIQILDALDYMHTRTPPVIHRDIKPGNIRIASDGKAMLVDFGISKVADPIAKTALGARAVSPGFSPVEQYGFARTDARSDLYALGATLYYALTAQAPPEAVLLAGQNRLVPPSQLEPGIPPSVESAILKSMQLSMDARYRSAAEMKQALMLPPAMPYSRIPTAQPTAMVSANLPASQPPVARPHIAAPAVPQPAPQPVAGSLPYGMEIADLGTRFVAALIDGIVSALLGAIAAAPVAVLGALLTSAPSSATSFSSSDTESVLTPVAGILAVLVVAWYYVHFTARTGQTLGKKWMHIKVVDEKGDPISKGRALVRWLIFAGLPAIVTALTCGVPLGYGVYAIPLVDSQRRGLHDMIVKTRVVKA